MTRTNFSFTPQTDGIDHFNIYSRARTPAGRLLSNFARTPFTLDGVRFASVEGFYHSMLFDDTATREKISGQHGAEAKRWGKVTAKKPGDPCHTWDGRVLAYKTAAFDDEMCRAIRAKVDQNPEVRAALLSTGDLPLTHYYVMWGRPLSPKGEGGVLEKFFMDLRDELCEAAMVVEADEALAVS